MNYLTLERRKAIIQDVLDSLERRNIQEGSYLYGKLDPTWSPDVQLRDYMVEIEKECTICAKGAIFLSKVSLYNNFLTSQLETNSQGDLKYITMNNKRICQFLEPEFDKKELDLIECAFEEWYYGMYYEVYREINDDIFINRDMYDMANHAINFGRTFDDPVSKLEAIMLNMKAYNTYFVPSGSK